MCTGDAPAPHKRAAVIETVRSAFKCMPGTPGHGLTGLSINVTVKKALRMVAILRHLRSAHRFSSKHLLRVYQVYIRPLLEYSSTTWSALPASSAHRLQSVQNKALTIANIDLNTLASLQERRAAALSSLFDRILSDSVPSHFLNFCSWPSVSALSNRNLRNSAAVRLPVLNLPCSCPPLCILLALLLTIRVRPGLNYSLRFTLLISLIAFV